MDRVIVVSSDAHVTARPADYTQYIDPQYRDAYKDSMPSIDAVSRVYDNSVEDGGFFFSAEGVAHRKEVERELLHEGALAEVQWDSALRTRALEADGVVAEVLFPNGTPFWIEIDVINGTSRAYPAELQAAGKRAYNRWLADFCADLPGRRIGVAQISLHDVDAAVAEIEWAANAGLKGIMYPAGMMEAEEPEMTAIYNPRFERLWDALDETGLVVHVHGGASPEYYTPDVRLQLLLLLSEAEFWSRRPLWFMLWSGALERHPELNLVFTEVCASWVPSTLEHLDAIYHSKEYFGFVKSILPRSPSEYWHRQCHVGASMLTAAEVDMRDAIGVDNIMFGVDFPHIEGTWPNTKKWLQSSVGGIPQDEVRKILGENAIKLYGLDRDVLQAAADRVGPTVEELSERRILVEQGRGALR